MLNPMLRAIAQQQRRIARLEAEIAASRSADLAALPARYGFASLREFARAVREAARSRPHRPPARVAKQPANGMVTKPAAERPTRGLTWLTKKETERCAMDIQAGVATPKLLKKYRISYGALYQFKKKHGLAKPRGAPVTAVHRLDEPKADRARP